MILLAAVFLSGVSALLFETLWFRLTGLSLGNGVWASSLVLCAFMAGLALGSGLSGWLAPRLRRPLVAYAVLEGVVGTLGLALVVVLPLSSGVLGPLLRPLLERPLPLNALRLLAALALLVAPAAAMGATLPTLVRALPREQAFGRLLGKLYGANTLGAVLGAFAGEAWLIGPLGIRGTAVVAAALNLGAAALALAALRFVPATGQPPPPRPAGRIDGRARALLAAAFGCGAILLALEVVWFRFLALSVLTTGLTFAAMLAVVLAGLAVGSFVAGRWSAWRPEPQRYAPEIALVAGALVVVTYALGGAPTTRFVGTVRETLGLSAALMLPVCVISGLLFVLLGAGLQSRVGDEARATGALTMANTVGAMVGALLAGFALLPRLGMEVSVLVLALAYGVVALLPALGAAPTRSRGERLARAAATGAFVLAVARFPLGTASANIQAKASYFTNDGSTVVAVREGLLETLVYLRRDLWQQPLYHRMLTNGFTMSGTTMGSARYMKLFAYWPLALRPDSRHALLICYGVGNTAQALARTPGLASVDVVDISPDVLEMSPLVFPKGERPLDDPRFRVHVEDGRFFLLATDRRFDLITAEPPPPKNAGVVNLYSREYFQLVHDRLTEGGIATHWLPVYQLSPADAKAIIAAFCSVFDDCTLWSGSGLEWMLAGTRGLAGAPSDEGFSRQWHEPGSAADLKEVGLEVPEQLGALFIADAPFLFEMVRAHAPLEDDHPLRLSPRPQPGTDPFFLELMDASASRQRFSRSAFVRRYWPAEVRERTDTYFAWREVINRLFLHVEAPLQRMEDLRQTLTASTLRTLPLLLMDTNLGELRLAEAAAARGVRDPLLVYLQGLSAMADRDYEAAEVAFREAERTGARVDNLSEARALARALAGDLTGARALVQAGRPEFRAWLEQAFPLPIAVKTGRGR